MEVSIKGKTSLNSLVGIGSKTEVDGLEETFAFVRAIYYLHESSVYSGTRLKLIYSRSKAWHSLADTWEEGPPASPISCHFTGFTFFTPPTEHSILHTYCVIVKCTVFDQFEHFMDITHLRAN